MLKHTFSFCLLSAFALIAVSSFFVKSKAQESDFLIGDDATSEEDKSSEYLIPDSPFTDDKENDKKKVSEENKKIKEVQSPKSPEKAVISPVTGSTQNTEDSKATIVPSKPVEQTADEENPLSFNFLYYIIHKFKFSDVADQ